MFTLIPETHIDFMGKRRFFFIFSGLLTLIGIVSYVAHGGLQVRHRLRGRTADRVSA